MCEPTPNVTFYLRIYLRGAREDLSVKVGEKEWRRFRNSTINIDSEDNLNRFFICSTIDGKYIALNIKKIQAVNILDEVVPWVEGPKFHRGPIKFLLSGKENFYEVCSTTDPEKLYDCFDCLEHGPAIAGPFISFPDEDDEEMIINMDELLYIEAPQSLTDKGWKLWSKEMGIEE